jgi:hypothetical protein
MQIYHFYNPYPGGPQFSNFERKQEQEQEVLQGKTKRKSKEQHDNQNLI